MELDRVRVRVRVRSPLQGRSGADSNTNTPRPLFSPNQVSMETGGPDSPRPNPDLVAAPGPGHPPVRPLRPRSGPLRRGPGRRGPGRRGWRGWRAGLGPRLLSTYCVPALRRAPSTGMVRTGRRRRGSRGSVRSRELGPLSLRPGVPSESFRDTGLRGGSVLPRAWEEKGRARR